MNNNEITFLNNDNVNNNGVITPIEVIEDPIKPKVNPANDETDFITIPDWDLTPPFDSIDRSDMQ
ncbi:MAG: hypothetical protein J6X02_02530 [Bacilli bacterium]|nr:hypothetical protein [Bacilli bacterium]